MVTGYRVLCRKRVCFFISQVVTVIKNICVGTSTCLTLCLLPDGNCEIVSVCANF
jgi:hypothetical protein